MQFEKSRIAKKYCDEEAVCSRRLYGETASQVCGGFRHENQFIYRKWGTCARSGLERGAVERSEADRGVDPCASNLGSVDCPTDILLIYRCDKTLTICTWQQQGSSRIENGVVL